VGAVTGPTYLPDVVEEQPPLDLAVAVAFVAATVATTVTHRAMAVGSPVVRLLLRPPLVGARLQPGTWLDGLAAYGGRRRAEVEHRAAHVLDLLVPQVTETLLRRVDLTAVVRNHVDLAGLVDEVLAEIDLPEIIRESTGSVTSDTVRGIRMQGITGDEAVERILQRFRPRHPRHPAPELDPTTRP
jgi:hypothetical protein